ncbi:TadE/TadG family type IV pilus assembly protein [Salidesulfovibrio onnuriiensis]|uniref:TadE/TadG family type IV pilus assembly protein n=1 Tax=Salidesulfovibrio onnuriiensis TaxID=2583823 RepID=UPI0011C972EC|nr:TadE/TadG family type IV pilus assembly protein [Salidesulfovibrio onnuriiensis]
MDRRNTQYNDSRKGIAATELALMLPLIVLLLFVLVEASTAMHTYTSLQEASREGARMVLLQGEDADVVGLVKAIITEIPDDAVNTVVTTDQTQKTVTVTVSCEYVPFKGGSDGTSIITGETDTYTLQASTTMPIP